MHILKISKISTPLWYKNHNAPKNIVELTALGNKQFGSVMEKITGNIFKCENIKDTNGQTGWDLEKNKHRIELKSSRYWRANNKHHWVWQHILPDHEWAYVMMAGVDFNKIRYFIIPKPQFMDLIAEGKITKQGNAGGQGCWLNSKDIEGIHEFTENEDLSEQLSSYIAEHPSSHEPISSDDINKAYITGKIARNKKIEERKAIPLMKKEEKKLQKKNKKNLRKVITKDSK